MVIKFVIINVLINVYQNCEKDIFEKSVPLILRIDLFEKDLIELKQKAAALFLDLVFLIPRAVCKALEDAEPIFIGIFMLWVFPFPLFKGLLFGHV